MYFWKVVFSPFFFGWVGMGERGLWVLWLFEFWSRKDHVMEHCDNVHQIELIDLCIML